MGAVRSNLIETFEWVRLVLTGVFDGRGRFDWARSDLTGCLTVGGAPTYLRTQSSPTAERTAREGRLASIRWRRLDKTQKNYRVERKGGRVVKVSGGSGLTNTTEYQIIVWEEKGVKVSASASGRWSGL